MKPNNPPAFPSGLSDPSTDDVALPINTGISMRDYFAAKAMQSMLPAYGGIPYPMDNLSTQAYAQADSMLKAREQ